MKVKITLIVSQNDHRKSFDSDDFFRYLVTKDNELPSCYISTKDEKETLKSLYEEYLNVYFDWVNISLIAFRKTKIDECEVIYCCKIPHMISAEKKGKFISHNERIYLDKFYEQLLSTRSRPGFFWS